MDDIRRNNSLEVPRKNRLTASEERLTDIHKQWELGTKFHVSIRVRPMTVREIKESAKVHHFLRMENAINLIIHYHVRKVKF